MALFNECMQSCALIVLDTADIVRDGDLSPMIRSTLQQDTPKLRRTADLVQLRNAAQENCALVIANRIGFTLNGITARDRDARKLFDALRKRLDRRCHWKGFPRAFTMHSREHG
jgi:hypothetical protein